MKRTLIFFTALLLASPATQAQQSAPDTVRDRLWIFTVIEGGNNKKSPASPGGNTEHYIDDFAPGGSRMTPAEGAFWLGVPNLLFIRSNNLPALPSDEIGRKNPLTPPHTPSPLHIQGQLNRPPQKQFPSSSSSSSWKTHRADVRRILTLAVLLPGFAFADEATAKAGKFFGQYCTQCHGAEKSKGKVTLHDFSFAPGKEEKLKLWERVLEALEGGDMPPEDEKNQPTVAERKEIAALFEGELRRQTLQPAGVEKGAARARRLTNFEYENTMRDLLGVDLRLKESLPEDPVKPYHFNNTAEFMLVGPEQIERYQECAKRALASAIVDPVKPEARSVRKEWKLRGVPSGLDADEVGIWGNNRDSAAKGFAIENPPQTGEFRIRFKASAILPAGVSEVPLRLVMGYDLMDKG